ncbi:hypothetical protein FJY93_01415 [Candidatus Kaiserbacteria bacterium]|nr:hypothetical protein [Candidatus Kaiserbacteria bacterium]
MERRAARLGVTLDQLREYDRKALRESDYPTADCLGEHEISDARLRKMILHVLECPMCAALLDVAEQDAKASKM